ncbi:MAG: DNA polymerase IV [Spirochaetota bacterium]
MSHPVILHVDMDAFYASIEQHDHPEYRGKPVIVGAAPGHRGVVSACSYEARPFGIHSAMPINEAYRLCPQGVYLPVRMRRYQEVSGRIMAILAEYTPTLQQISVDEAFLDLTGTRRLLGDPEDVGRTIKVRVREETGLTISVGIAPSHYLAKLASEVDKPDGFYVVRPGQEADFVVRLPLKSMWGVGKKMLARLHALGIETVAQLREYTRQELAVELGTGAAHYLYAVSRGVDPGLYSEARSSHSISGERTFEHDVTSPDALDRALLEIAHTCTFRLMEEGAHSRTVTLKLRLTDFTTFTLRRTLSHEVTSADELYRSARELLQSKWDRVTPVRLVGCGLGNVESGPPDGQQDLFDRSSEKRMKLERAVYRLRQQGLRVKKARLLDEDEPDA